MLRALEALLETQARNVRSFWTKCLQALEVKVESAWLWAQCCLLPSVPVCIIWNSFLSYTPTTLCTYH